MQQASEQAGDLAQAMQDGCLGVRVGRLHRLVGRQFDQALRPLGLSISQMEILSALTLISGPVRPADLGTWLAIERSTMSRNLSLMEKKGLIAAAESSASGRSMSFVITEQGTEALTQASAAWNGAQTGLLQLVGPDAAPTLDTWISQLTQPSIGGHAPS